MRKDNHAALYYFGGGSSAWGELVPYPPTHTSFLFFETENFLIYLKKYMNFFSFFEKCSGKLKYIHDSDSDPVNCTYPLPIPEGC